MLSQQIIEKLQRKDVKKHLQSKGIEHVWLFGSHARQNSSVESDVDILYSFDENSDQSSFEFFSAIVFLKEIIGKPIDMLSLSSLEGVLKTSVLSSKIPIW